MTNIQIFENQNFGQVRTVQENGKVLFCGADVAKALGYAVPRKAIIDHCKGVLKRNTPTNGGIQEMSFISEGDVYRLITHSKLPSAEQFEKWVFDEVLPTIRQTGGYVANDEMFLDVYFPSMEDEERQAFKQTLVALRKKNEIIKQQRREIEHKEDVIIGLVDEISLADKRQILNRVVRYNHANYRDRWSVLYREFENKYHINLTHRFETYNETHKPKCSSKVDYIDKVMGKIPELYEIAAKLFENDVKALVDEMYSVAR